MDIKPFLHQHYLLCDEHENQEACCDKCNEKIDGWAFTCESCKFWLHESCASQLLPQSILHPLHSQHCLYLSCNHDYFACDKCFTLARGWTYKCKVCDFAIDLICASSSTTNDQTSMEGSQRSNQSSRKIKHFSHSHVLTPFYYRKAGKDHCSCLWCEKLLSGLSYGCLSDRCRNREVFFHESCLTNMPIAISQQHFHLSHLLRLYLTQREEEHKCNGCKEQCLILEGRYSCQNCEFNLHVCCATFQPSLKYELHNHDLTYFRIKGYKGNLRCKICHEKIPHEDGSNEGVFYACVQCDFYLHLHCLVPFKTKHEYHRHELILTNSVIEDYSDEYYCDICEEERKPRHHVYYCNKCSFVTHIECALNKLVDAKLDHMKLMKRKETNLKNLKIDHFDHEHSLTFYEVIEQNERLLCKACCLKISGQAYACKLCEYYLHKTCTQLSQKLLHPLHPSHALHLVSIRSIFQLRFLCQKCRGCYYDGFAYKCYLCDFVLDVKCATDQEMSENESEMIEETKRQSKLCLFNQKHKLSFINYAPRRKKFRFSQCCEKDLVGPSYRCSDCGYNIHEFCLGFLPEMQLKFHPQHPVHLLYNVRKPCRVCGYSLHATIGYSCGQCDLYLHAVCAKYSAKEQVTKFEVHNHGLSYYRGIIPYSLQNICGECMKRISYTPFYFCPECSDFKLHFKCARIPHSIKSKYHIHPFVLMNNFVEDDSGQYYCDICEEERAPLDHVYYCKQCQGLFVAHIECVLDSVEETTPTTQEAYSNDLPG
ncbi:hypothetical protein DITRI_Ditri06bG0018500 [Diplodiscus trichospermus]